MAVSVREGRLAQQQLLASLEPDVYERVQEEAKPAQPRSWLTPSRARDLVWLIPVLSAASLLHGWNMLRSPMPFDDEGTYVSQAWALATGGELSHYTYWYDHPPLGWALLAVWNLPFRLLGVDEWVAGRIGMLVVHVAVCAMLYSLARRLAPPRWAAAIVPILVTASPTMQQWGRLIMLDNIGAPLVLGAWLLALDRRQRTGRFALSAVLLAAAVLVKETNAIYAPAILWSLVLSARAHRRYVLPLYAWLVGGMGMAYVLYAAMKNELFDGPGHVSLEWALRWQLFTRVGSGSVFDPTSSAAMKVTSWFEADGATLAAGALAALGLLWWRRLRPVALVVGLLWAMVLRGGYIPGPYPVGLLWPSALAVGLALGRCGALMRRWRLPRAAYAAASVVVAVAVASVVAVGIERSQMYFTEDKVRQYREATAWVVVNTEPSDVIVVDNSLWFDLVKAGKPRENVVWFQKPNTDPDVDNYLVNGWKDVDYVVLTLPLQDMYRERQTTREALENARVVARFDELVVYQVVH